MAFDDEEFSYDQEMPQRPQAVGMRYSFDPGSAPILKAGAPSGPEVPSFEPPPAAGGAPMPEHGGLSPSWAPTTGGPDPWTRPTTAGPDPYSYHQPAGAGPLAPSAAGAERASQPARPYAGVLDQLRQEADPSKQAMLRDQLSRSLFTSLKDGGHDVKWQGDQLIVDGRPYEVGGGAAPTGGGGDAPGAQRPTGEAPVLDRPQGDGLGFGGRYGAMPGSGYEAQKWSDPNSTSAKYITGRSIDYEAMRRIPDEAGRKAFLAQEVERIKPLLEQAGWTVHEVKGDGAVISGNGYPPGFVDLVGDIEGAATPAYTDDASRAGGGGGGMPPALPPLSPSAPIGAGNTPFQQYTTPAAGPQPSWAPGQGPTYTPGDITLDDLPNYSFDDIFGMLTADDEKSAALLDDLLANPESLDQHTIEMLQARAKEELAQQQLLEEEEIKRMGGSLGIEDSNWLKSERLASRRDRDMGVVKSNRDIEIEAARTNTADKRAAAQLGLSYDTMKSGERQAAAALAADVTLKQAALRGDRMALQESVKQKAAELGISEDQVMSSWLLGLADDATRNRAISAEDARSIRELAQRDKEFGYEIAYRLAALAQQDEQFGAQWGLDWTRLQHDIDQDHYGRYTDTF
jgi:hypothetical protein